MTPTRIGWTSLAIAAAASVFVGVTVLNDSTARTGELQHRLEATPPATANDLRQLGDQVDQLATAPPTIVVQTTAVPGPPGAAGATGPAGPAGTITVQPAPVRSNGPAPPVVTRTTPPRSAAPPSSTPAPTSTPTATSSAVPCSLPAFLAGVCVQR